MPQNFSAASKAEQPDPAAIFACAHSLWEYGGNNFNLSEMFHGVDGFMRTIMQVGDLFEKWACNHVAFDELNDCWPYLLQASFGRACFDVIGNGTLEGFNEQDCLRLAFNLKLPIRLDSELPVPVNFAAQNPNQNSGFPQIRIQSIRESLEDHITVPLVLGDDPFDEEYGNVYFGLYGVGPNGLLEHIADRKSYMETVQLAQKLFPGVTFPRIFQQQNA